MEATLQEILDAREKRATKQKELLARYGKPLLCFSMNIPGPEKWNGDISIGFAVGNLLLRNALGNAKILHFEKHQSTAGCEAYYVVDLSAQQLKRIAIETEMTDPIGRLFDMDVLNEQGQHLSREDFGMGPRKCLICDQDARVCARSRNHGLEVLVKRTHELLQIAATQWLAEYIAAKAYLALIQEVNTTPKPGLVDRNNQGAHKDMSLQHFFASANALRPYFCLFAKEGYLTKNLSPRETFRKIREIGKKAEAAMLEATGGVNTHKGAIFSLGLLCAAAGRVPPYLWSVETLLDECAAMVKDIVAADFSNITTGNAKTAGEKLFVEYGIAGVRGQAEAGFPAVKYIGYPIYQEALQNGYSSNDAGSITLLHLITATDDTNLIHRCSREHQLKLQQWITDILKANPYPDKETILNLDREFIKRNLSPGGCADLLAMVCFLDSIENT